MKLILSIGLVLSSMVSFSQASYFDKGAGSDESMKLGSATMDMITENNVEGIWENWSPKSKPDTTGVKEMGNLVSEKYQAGEGHEAVIEIKDNVPVASYERTFYQSDDAGNIQYLFQIKISMSTVNGKTVISTIHALNGAAVHRYDRLLKADSVEPKEPREPKEPKEPPVRHRKGDDDDDEN